MAIRIQKYTVPYTVYNILKNKPVNYDIKEYSIILIMNMNKTPIIEYTIS